MDTPVFFAFDGATSSLLFLHPETGRPTPISCTRLRELGWQADDADFRKSLPRVDRPLIQSANGLPPLPSALRRK
jgi:hypothetical protein